MVQRAQRRRPFSRSTRLIYWIIFDVICAFSPIILATFIFITNGNDQDYTNLIVHGESILISTALAASAIGELWIWHIRKRTTEDTSRVNFSFAACFLAFFFGVMWYLVVSQGVKYTNITAIITILMVLGTLVVIGIGKWHATEV